MRFIACTQDHIAPDECIECGGWLHHERRGGFPGPCGSYCSEDCAVSAQEHGERLDRAAHLHQRDLLCDCPVCTAAGHPTADELAEWTAYQQAVAR